MKSMSLFKAVWLVSRYKKLSASQQRELQQKRLRELVEHARTASPYFARLYASIPSDFDLTDLPPTNKVELMRNFDEWVTDRTVHLADVQHFMENLDNIGRKFKGKYLVFTTSGSTGNPSVVLNDDATQNISGAINSLRAFARAKDLKEFFKRGGKTVGVFATGGFYLGNSSVRSRLLQMPWKKRQMMVTSVLNPLPQIVSELNAFQPAMLGGYPTALELLMEEQKQGRLHVSPTIIMTGGEYLSPELRQALAETFHCYVQTSYSCTEGGTLACECLQQHFHVNDDWIIVEAVDQNNRPVPDGVQSDKILITNFSNYTQPFIRYEITDRVILHHEPCACGNPAPWLEIEGRTDDILSFAGNGGTVRIAPLALYALLKETHSLQRFQLIAHPENRLELRIVEMEGFNREEAFQRAEERLREFLAANAIPSVRIELSLELPQPHPQSGKFKHVYLMNE